MDDAALQKRLDVSLALSVANLLVLLGIGLQYAPETTVGLSVLALLVGYGFLQGQ